MRYAANLVVPDKWCVLHILCLPRYAEFVERHRNNLNHRLGLHEFDSQCLRNALHSARLDVNYLESRILAQQVLKLLATDVVVFLLSHFVVRLCPPPHYADLAAQGVLEDVVENKESR